MSVSIVEPNEMVGLLSIMAIKPIDPIAAAANLSSVLGFSSPTIQFPPQLLVGNDSRVERVKVIP
jgi:hypothetical protein